MTLAYVLNRARLSNNAVGAFNTYNSDITQAIIDAATRAQRPVIVQTSAGKPGAPLPRSLMAQTVAAAGQASATVGVHLDHCRDLEQIKVALDLGYNSVMIDGSHLPIEGNIELTAQAVAMAERYDAWVEGELGSIPGDEHHSSNASSAVMTDPDQARLFAQATQVDALAVAVGNVHGYTASALTIDIDRLERIASVCPVPLVLHGASGVEAKSLTQAVQVGVVKININTELRQAYLSNLAVDQALKSGWSIDTAVAPARRAVQRSVEDKIAVLWPW